MFGKILKAIRIISEIDREVERNRRMGKPWYRSKTIWTNMIALAVVILSLKGIEVTPEEQSAILAGILAIVNIVLRLITKDPVRIK